MIGPGGHHIEWGNTITKELKWYVLTDKWILAQKLSIVRYKVQDAKHMKLKKKTKVWTLCPFLELETLTHGRSYRNKVCSWEERMDHPETAIISHEMQTLLHMPARFCWKDPDIAVSGEAMPVPGKYRSGCSLSSIGWNTGPPMEELEKVPKELKGSATL